MKKYYWLKLQKDFFKRHDIRIVEHMPNGKDYILFYMKLLLESISHEGMLRFSETIPYNEDMLATITDTNIDVVRSALKLFGELNMVEVLDDSTIFMTEVSKMIGSETESAERVRKHREGKKALQCNTCNAQSNLEIEIELDKEIDIDKDIYINNNTIAQSVELKATHLKRFDEFWRVYPKKVGKQAALKQWERIKPNEELFKKILSSVEEHKSCDQWKKSNGQFIPHPATWLSQGRWDDVLEVEQEEELY